MSSNGVCYPEQECWCLRLQNLPNFQDKLEIQTLKKIHSLNIFYMLAETVFRTLGGGGGAANKTSLCSRCGPWATSLQFLPKYSFWGNSVYVALFIYLIYGPVTSESVSLLCSLKCRWPLDIALHHCALPACSRFSFPTTWPLSCLFL